MWLFHKQNIDKLYLGIKVFSRVWCSSSEGGKALNAAEEYGLEQLVKLLLVLSSTKIKHLVSKSLSTMSSV